MPVPSGPPRYVPSISPTVGKFWMPLKPTRLSSSRKTSISRNGSVPHTPASTGVFRATGSTSAAISTTIAFASPNGIRPAREPRVVDAQPQPVRLDLGLEVLAQSGEERLVGGRIVEDLALDGDHRDPLERHEERGRPRRRLELARDQLPEHGALLRRGAHERDRRVVDVEVPLPVALGNGVQGPEVDHVERAERDDLRKAELARRLPPV